jgi:transcriptional regulator with XRE-family HTH domain
MARRSKLKLPPVDSRAEPLSQRIARLRKERGYTETELAERIGIIRPWSPATSAASSGSPLREMAIRFATALELTADELLRSNGSKPSLRKPSRGMERIQELPPRNPYSPGTRLT